MRIALIVGIDYYSEIPSLHGCVNDAHSVKAVLERHDGGSVNFDCNLLTASNEDDAISKDELKDSIKQLFDTKAEIALLYFAGHGHIEEVGGFLVSSDVSRSDNGMSLAEILVLANRSPSTNKVIILDSCHSGIAGDGPQSGGQALLSEGLTVLTASTAEQYASEVDGAGVFTNLLVDALRGSAANLVGDVTPGSVYAHIDQSLGAWEQRPIFKTNVRTFVSLREVAPAIPIEHLKLLHKLFPYPGFEFQLDPSFEPEVKSRPEGIAMPIEENTTIFAILQKYNRLNLLVPLGAPHMWHAAINSKSCKLTALGEHYRRLAAKARI